MQIETNATAELCSPPNTGCFIVSLNETASKTNSNKSRLLLWTTELTLYHESSPSDALRVFIIRDHVMFSISSMLGMTFFFWQIWKFMLSLMKYQKKEKQTQPRAVDVGHLTEEVDAGLAFCQRRTLCLKISVFFLYNPVFLKHFCILPVDDQQAE